MKLKIGNLTDSIYTFSEGLIYKKIENRIKDNVVTIKTHSGHLIIFKR